MMPADAGTVKSSGKTLPPTHRKEALFYLPDAILPWAEQRVSWALNFFAKLYTPTWMTVSDLIQPLRLDEIMKSQMSSLSKGERKRLLLALGLLTNYDLLLLDEPFDGLDLRQTRDVMTLLKNQAVK